MRAFLAMLSLLHGQRLELRQLVINKFPRLTNLRRQRRNLVEISCRVRLENRLIRRANEFPLLPRQRRRLEDRFLKRHANKFLLLLERKLLPRRDRFTDPRGSSQQRKIHLEIAFIPYPPPKMIQRQQFRILRIKCDQKWETVRRSSVPRIPLAGK